MVNIASPKPSSADQTHNFLNSMGWIICLLILVISFITVFVGYQTQKRAARSVLAVEETVKKNSAEIVAFQEKSDEASNKVQEISLEINRLKKDLFAKIDKIAEEHHSLQQSNQELLSSVQNLTEEVETLKQAGALTY